MRGFGIAFLVPLLGGCSVGAASEAAPVEYGPAPTFDDIAHLASSTSREVIPNTSCECVENGKCATSEIRVEWQMGSFERQNETCTWNIASQILSCTYEERFVRESTPYPYPSLKKEDLKEPPERVKTAGEWRTIAVNAKRLSISDGTQKWCVLPTENLEG